MSEGTSTPRGTVELGPGILFVKSRQPEVPPRSFFDPDIAAAEVVAALRNLGCVVDRGRALNDVSQSMYDLHEGLIHDFPEGKVKFRPSYLINVGRHVLTVNELLLRYNRGREDAADAETSRKILGNYTSTMHNRRTMPGIQFALGEQAAALMYSNDFKYSWHHYTLKSADKQEAYLTGSQTASLQDESRHTRELIPTIADDIVLASIYRIGNGGEWPPFAKDASRKLQLTPRPGRESPFIPVVDCSADGAQLRIKEKVRDADYHIGVMRMFTLKEGPK